MTRASMPLAGIRVVELGELLAGPLIGTLLAEFGAEVIKIERPGRGDVLRQFGPIVDGESLFWKVNARAKKSVVLDLAQAPAREVLHDLLAKSDVLVQSLRPGTLEGWGFDDVRLKESFPRLVVVHASAFGRGGDYSARGGYDPIAQGYSGLSFLTGEADGPPMRAGGAIPVCDFTTGFAGALGAVLALYGRDRGNGAAASIDIALYDVAFRMLGPLLAYHDLTGAVWQRNGNRSLGGAPTGHFRTSDGHWMCTSVQNDEQFSRLSAMIGQPQWLADPRFESLRSRTQNRAAIEEVVVRWIAERPRDEVLALFEEAGLPAGPINSMADLAEDPHLRQRGTFWSKLGERAYRQPTRVPRLADEDQPSLGESPGLGEHTMDVLRDTLCYGEPRIDALRGAGVVR
jgi:crotonobetainyl-CoA:carnitine CoA-transferase CaiB-like acyl-CoA transferase